MDPLPSEYDRSLVRSRLRTRALLALNSLGEAHLGQLARHLSRPSYRVAAALMGRPPEYGEASSLVGLGLVRVELRSAGRVFVITARGRRKARSVARWVGASRGRARVDAATLVGPGFGPEPGAGAPVPPGEASGGPRHRPT